MPSNLSKKELTDIIQWDVKNWKNALSFWEAHFDIRPGMKVLALGEREGGLSLYFAQLHTCSGARRTTKPSSASEILIWQPKRLLLQTCIAWSNIAHSSSVGSDKS